MTHPRRTSGGRGMRELTEGVTMSHASPAPFNWVGGFIETAVYYSSAE